MTAERWRGLLFFVLLALAIAWPANRMAGVNVQARFATTVRVVEDGTFELGEYAKTTSDLARVGNRYYTDKAPGLSLILVPFYAVARHLAADFDTRRHATRLLSLTLATLLTLLAWDRRMRRAGVDEFTRRTAVAFLGIGTFAWAYWAMLFGHGPAALAIFWGVLLLIDYRRDRENWRLLIASALGFGAAIFLEYPTAVLGGVAGVFLLTFERRVGRVALFAFVGAVLPALLILNYNNAVFGDPFHLGYSQVASDFYQEKMSQGFFGIGAPSWKGFSTILLMPSKGLLFWSPSALASIAALVWAVRNRRAEGIYLAATIGVFILVLSGYFEASGAACLGPRHLTPLVGPMAIALAMWLPEAGTKAKAATFGFVASTALLIAVGVAADPQVHNAFENPLTEFLLPLLASGEGAGNILGLADGPAAVLLVILVIAVMALAAAPLWKPSTLNRRYLAAAFGVGLTFICLAHFVVAPRLGTTDPGIVRQAWANYWAGRHRWDDAAVAYEKAYEINDNPVALYYLIYVHMQAGQRDAAAQAATRLAREHPDFHESIRAGRIVFP
ncbi:MAG: hypothetical protein H6685_09445 [Deltaproteobacteria bacterium]|nr:hypothetical protein [Deltaproteobacteria bacterium]